MLKSNEFRAKLENLVSCKNESEQLKLLTELATQYDNDIMENSKLTDELATSNADRDNYKSIATKYWKTSVENENNQSKVEDVPKDETSEDVEEFGDVIDLEEV